MVALFNTDYSNRAFLIVDGFHPDLGLIPFNENKLTWCSGGMKFTSVKKHCASAFYPSQRFATKTLVLDKNYFQTLFKSQGKINTFVEQFVKK